MVMALLADGRTGVGISGQATIAAAMGCSDRHVRHLLTALAVREGAPVIVIRRRRGAALGRTSDEYTLSLPLPERCAASDNRAEPEGRSASVSSANRYTVPVEQRPLPERHDSPTGTVRQPKRNSASGGHLSDQLSDQQTSAPRREKPPVVVPVPGAHELKLHYVAEFKRTRQVEPQFGKRWSRAMKSFGELVTTHGLELSKQIATRALDDRPYTRRINPWELVDDAIKYVAPMPAKRNAGPPRQMGVRSEAEAMNYGSERAQRMLARGAQKAAGA